MAALLIALTLVLFAAPALAIVRPGSGRAAAIALAAAALVAALVAAPSLGSEAQLEVRHAFAAYVGQEVRSKDFIVDRAAAAGWQWPLLVVLWCLGYAVWLLRARGIPPSPRPLVAPLVLAWSGSALLLGLQKLAAPAPLALGIDLPPLPPFEAAILPAAVAAALRIAAEAPKVWHVPLLMSLFVALAHLPLAIFGTIATRQQLGTYLDVHTVDFIANPFTQMPTELAPGSTEQLTWLVWVPQLVVLPALTLMSAGGLGFAAWMARREQRRTAALGK